ncbi:MAG: OmpA family protein [Alphaproteobacteria bacterium]|nr:OmpA family protein [Alphaproteobacteria bacterium]
MKKLFGITLGVAGLLAINTANASELNPYVSVKGHRLQARYDTYVNGDEGNYKADVDDKNWGVSAAVGVKWANFRSEFEYNLNKKFKDTNGVSRYAHPTLKTQSFMLNEYYDFDNDSKITPYVGGGVGLARINLNSNDNFLKSTQNKFAWQLGAGLMYKLTNDLSLDAGYRYQNYNDAKKSIGDNDLKTRIRIHDVYLGLTYNFGKKCSKKEPKKVVGKLALKGDAFASGSSRLSQAGKADISKALSEYKGERNFGINVYGYTDRIGSVEANKALSQRRADAVAEEIRANGYGKQIKNVIGYGEENPVTGNKCDGITDTKELNDCLAPDRRVEVQVVE